MPKDKRSFFERLTGTVRVDEDEELDFEEHQKHPTTKKMPEKGPQRPDEWMEESAEEGQLTVDVYNTANDIVIKTIVAGVKPEDLDISISRDMVTIRGKRGALGRNRTYNYPLGRGSYIHLTTRAPLDYSRKNML
jgi:HSP20 family molecular chaperone IbpA